MNEKVLEYKFNNEMYNLLPRFNDGFNYTYEDIVEGTITNRTIYSSSLPTGIWFGCDDNATDIRSSSSLLEVLYINTNNLTTLCGIFARCVNLTYVNSSDWDISNVTDSSWAFNNCHSLETLDVSGWCTTNIKNMEFMFRNCYKLNTLDVSKWDMSNVTNIFEMFVHCEKINGLDVSNWNTSNMIRMDGVFNNCQSLTSIDVSNWDITNIKNLGGMFNNTALTSLDLSKWDTSNVEGIGWMFFSCDTLIKLDISNWDLNKVTTMENIFNDCPSLTSIIMTDSDYTSINKILEQLPPDNGERRTINIHGVDDITKVINIDSWNINNSHVTVKIEISESMYKNITIGNNRIKNIYICKKYL